MFRIFIVHEFKLYSPSKKLKVIGILVRRIRSTSLYLSLHAISNFVE